MLCKRCNVVMKITGTSYWNNQNRGRPTHKRFCECPKCHDRVYNNSSNFQETLSCEFEKRRNK